MKLESWINARGEAIPLLPEDHGLARTYDKGCRCDDCVAAYRKRCKEAKERRKRRPIPEHVHGTWNGYANYDCRCARCLVACQEKYPDSAAYRRANRERLNQKRREYYKETGK
ncbi:hypothetical protein H7K38_02615 [Mycobacterium alsense]|uniref:Uncharacterized protein n=1 Tax=Mycobacterium alsense TaxID=324058 RepID=A0AA42BXH4_9MYCO|nr:hypothetical protein [Mycobacterium alsense]MCV7377547.1 hypothetical protein [Mycobacterium alsense]